MEVYDVRRIYYKLRKLGEASGEKFVFYACNPSAWDYLLLVVNFENLCRAARFTEEAYKEVNEALCLLANLPGTTRPIEDGIMQGLLQSSDRERFENALAALQHLLDLVRT